MPTKRYTPTSPGLFTEIDKIKSEIDKLKKDIDKQSEHQIGLSIWGFGTSYIILGFSIFITSMALLGGLGDLNVTLKVFSALLLIGIVVLIIGAILTFFSYKIAPYIIKKQDKKK